MTQPLVSVLMTAYNREKYIATAIESVLAQSMEDFELIVVDDGSTDASLQIVYRYASDPRVRIYPNEHNIGQFRTRNRAALLARGKYLKYVDSDDAIYPHCLEVMAHMMERHPLAGMLLCAWVETDSPYPFELSPLEVYRRCFIHGIRISNSPLTTMLRRTVFDEAGGFENDRWPMSADYELVLKMARLAPVVFAPTGLGFYRVHDGQIECTEGSLIRNFTSEGLAISIEALRHVDCPLSGAENKWTLANTERAALLFAGSLALKQLRPRAALTYLRDLKLLKGLSWSAARPDPPRFHGRNEPDWANYPRARVDRLEAADRTVQSNNGVSIVVAGTGTGQDWERTIRSALVQSETHLEVVAVNAQECSNPEPGILAKYPQVRVMGCQDRNIWLARNEAARQASGQFLKFVEPGTLLYPYAAEFGAHALKVNPEYNFTAWGQLSTMPYLTKLPPETAIACDLADGWQVFRVDLANATVRKSAFLKAQGFDSTWGEWAAYELFFRLSLERGVIHGMFSSSNRETTIRPGSAADMPPALRQHLEKLLTAIPGRQSWGNSPLELLANNAASLRQKALDGYIWDWSRYPWAQPRHGTPSVATSSGRGPCAAP